MDETEPSGIDPGTSHSAENAHLESFFAFLDEINKETERGAALTCAAMLDDLLARTLSAFMISNSGSKALLEGFNAPLGTFAARTATAFALGLISDHEYRDSEIIRKVRNEFAHSVHISFENDRLSALCRNLHHSAKNYADVVVNTRGQFTTGAVALISNLTNRPHYVAQRKLSYGEWRR